MSWLGLDIGGANLKIADGQGYADSVAFPLWKQPDQLATALETMLTNAPSAEALAVTMTGELADCFQTKQEGVLAILDAVESAAKHRETHVYLCNGCLVPLGEARTQPDLAAASNWVVLSNFVGRYCPVGPALLIDLGSTTCDIIPLLDGRPSTKSLTDTERMTAGELLYTGVRRSPICAVVSEIPFGEGGCRVAQEVFATTLDAYLMLGYLPEDSNRFDTADGRACTREASQSRLARTICADGTTFSMEDATQAARHVHRKQLDLIETATREVLLSMNQQPATIITSGAGEFLLQHLLERLKPTSAAISLKDELDAAVSDAACAHALAVLARERATS